MNMCEAHWAALRELIEARGLMHLVATSGELAAAQSKQQLETGEVNAVNYDPLLGAFWAIGANAFQMISGAGGDPLYLLGDGPEDKVDPFKHPRANGRTWPRCGVCYLSLAHELTCREKKCRLDRERGYDWMLETAADEAVKRSRELGLIA